jgi:hypothetical protein
MSLLLKQQASELEQALAAQRAQVMDEFDLPSYPLPSASLLRSQLLMQEHNLKEDLASMEEDLEMVQDDANFKLWLKSQKQLRDEPDFF